MMPACKCLLTRLRGVKKSTCTYLKAVNKQDKKKFKNMDITGTVNCQCSHVFVWSSVDMQFGERYVAVSHYYFRPLTSPRYETDSRIPTLHLHMAPANGLHRMRQTLTFGMRKQISTIFARMTATAHTQSMSSNGSTSSFQIWHLLCAGCGGQFRRFMFRDTKRHVSTTSQPHICPASAIFTEKQLNTIGLKQINSVPMSDK